MHREEEDSFHDPIHHVPPISIVETEHQLDSESLLSLDSSIFLALCDREFAEAGLLNQFGISHPLFVSLSDGDVISDEELTPTCSLSLGEIYSLHK